MTFVYNVLSGTTPSADQLGEFLGWRYIICVHTKAAIEIHDYTRKE